MDSQTYTSYQTLLFPIAYNMLGSQGDAEDLVQETLIKWLDVDHAKVDNPKAYLVRTLVNKCLNFLRDRKRETLVGEPETSPQEAIHIPFRVEHGFSLSMSLQMMLGKLSPMERAVFLLKDVFTYSHKEIAEILSITEENCRQILVRARRHLQKDKQRFQVVPDHHEEFLQIFMEVIEGDDLGHLLELLKEDIELEVIKPAASLIRKGRVKVGEYLHLHQAKGLRAKVELINGIPTLVWYQGNKVVFKAETHWEGSEIKNIRLEELYLPEGIRWRKTTSLPVN